jgi:hypothetical protein
MSYIDEKYFLGFIRDAERKTNARIMGKALKLSSGKYKAKTLAKLGHPYAERHKGAVAIPYNDPAKINQQSGKFYLWWRRYEPILSGSSLVSGVTNLAPYSKFLASGKPTTIPRPTIQALIPTAEYWRPVYIMRAIRNAIQANK